MKFGDKYKNTETIEPTKLGDHSAKFYKVWNTFSKKLLTQNLFRNVE